MQATCIRHHYGFCPHTTWINAEVVTLNFENLYLSLNEKRLYDCYERSANALFFPFFFFFFCLQWFMNLLICNRCVQPHTGKLWLVKSISILIILMLHIFAYRVWPLWKAANIFLLNEFFWMELSPPQPVMHFGRIQEQQRNYRIWWKKNWYKTKNSICRGDLSEATNITLFSAPSCQLSALLTQLWCSPFDIYQMVAKLAKYLEDFQDIFRRSSLI